VDKNSLSTREAAYVVGISTVAMVRKAKMLGAEQDETGAYRWPADAVHKYAASVEGKATNDPTRGKNLKSK